MFKEVWGKIEAKNCFQIQSWTKHLRETLVFISNRALQEKFNFCFSEVFCKYGKKFYFGKKAEHWAIFLLSFKILLMFPNFLYLKSFGNSRDNSYMPFLLLIITFRFTCDEKKVWSNIKRVSKHDDYDCLQNFNLLFMSLITAPIVKHSQILAGIYFILLKNVGQAWKAFSTKFGPQWKDRNCTYQVRHVLALFWKYVALVLG